MFDQALEYREKGLSVLPLIHQGKLPPRGVTWVEQQDALPTIELVESRFKGHPGCNIGCITGRGSRVVVIDADSKDAIEWVESVFPPTPITVGTGSTEKRHYYYKYPAIKDNSRIVSNSGVIHKDVDVRGDGGLVVLPPSVHKSGRCYQWVISDGFDFDFNCLPELPVELVIIEGERERGEGTSKSSGTSIVGNIGLQCSWLDHCRVDAATLPEPEWFAMLSIVGRCVNGEQVCHGLSKPYPKYTEVETDKKIKHALESGPATCRSISRWHDDCFECKNLGRGKNFSPIILGEEDLLLERVEVLTPDNITDEIQGEELPLSDYIINPSGLISEGMEALGGISQYAYPVVMTHIARALAGKITLCGVWPSLFCIKIGGTSTGKTMIDTKICNTVSPRISNFYGPTDFSSGPGLFRGVMENPSGMICMDEITYLFRRFDVHDPITSGKISALLEISTKAGQEIHKAYGDGKKTIRISMPCVNLLGNATPNIFDDFRPVDFETGLIQRFDFFSYDGEIPYECDGQRKKGKGMLDFIKKLKRIMGLKPEHSTELLEALGIPTELELTPQAEEIRASFSRKIIDRGNQYNKEDKPGFTGICSRMYTSALKYCMIHHVSGCIDKGSGDIFGFVGAESLLYGIHVAELLGEWKIKVLPTKIYEGDFHKDCEVFKGAILSAIRAGKKPTGKVLANRKSRLKELRPHEWQAIIRALTARKEIIVDESGKSTIYNLVK